MGLSETRNYARLAALAIGQIERRAGIGQLRTECCTRVVEHFIEEHDREKYGALLGRLAQVRERLNGAPPTAGDLLEIGDALGEFFNEPKTTDGS